ncbi:MAG: class I SAM-dependent methyltransferase [Candidatus Firestonebacteria bacterium]|nr:class I SAM-dependent methyltransferase [Candidatus Firestonebacteria bacterium]
MDNCNQQVEKFNIPYFDLFGDSNTIIQWDKLFIQKEWQLFFNKIHPAIPSFVNELKDAKLKYILDLGCGIGRHSIYLAKKGFLVSAFDKAEYGLKLTKELLEFQDLKADLKNHDINCFPYPYSENYFDAVISINVLYHTTSVNGLKAIKEIKRILKPGGYALFTLLSIYDPEYGNGLEIENNTFIFSHGYEKGVVHHFYNENEVKKIVSLFDESFYEHKILERAPNGEKGSYWIIRVKNPNLKMEGKNDF